MAMYFRNKATAAGVAALVFASSNQSAFADVLDLERIQVTAQKRKQSVQEVSVAVTAFSGEALRELNMTDSVDIASQTPGLSIGTPVGEGNNPSITLRGVGLNDFNDNNEGPIAVYRDEVYQSAMPGLTFQLFDMARVEVLRGPQGTLYGRNATGGLVHFISAKPYAETEGYADLSLLENNQIKLEAAITGAISDKVQGRLSIATNQHDGYVENRIGPDGNESDSFAYRAQINVDFTENFSALLSINGGENDAASAYYQHEVTDPSGVDFWGYSDTDGDNFAGDYDRLTELNIESNGAALTLTGWHNDIQIVSITSFQNVEKFHTEDTDMGPLPGILPVFASENDQFSQEIRISGETDNMHWVVGGFYFDNEVVGKLDLGVNYFADVIEGITGAPDGAFGPGDQLVPWLNYDVDYVQETTSSALFGQIEYNLSDTLKLIAGLRYTKEDRSMNYENRTDTATDAVLNSCLFFPGDVCGFFGDASWPGTNFYIQFNDNNPLAANLNEIDNSNVSGKIGLDYKPNDDILLFASISRGFKSGGFNGGFLDFTDAVLEEDIPFDEEQLTSYEVGMKSTLVDGSVYLNASAFYYDYSDYQALGFSGLSQFISNSDATVKGADLELVWMPGDKWDISLGASLLNTEVDEVVVRNQGAFTGTEMVLAPEFTLNGLVRYQVTDALSVQVDFNHMGEHFFDITNSEIAKEDAYTVFNARIGYEINDNLSVAAFVKNLSNEEYRVYTFDFTPIAGFNQQFYAPPRWAGVNIHYRF